MFDPERRQKLLSSPLMLFLYFGLIASTVTQLPNMSNGEPFSWEFVVTRGIPTGFIMTLVMLVRAKQLHQTTGLTLAQEGQMNSAIWKGVLPDDPAIKKALPNYLRKWHKQAGGIRKFGLAFLLLLALLQLVAVLEHRDTAQIVLSLLFIAIIAWSYHAIQRIIDNIEDFSARLGIDPTSDPEAIEIAPSDHFANDANARLFWIIAAMVILFPIFSSANSSDTATPAESSNTAVQEEVSQPGEEQATDGAGIEYSEPPSVDITTDPGVSTNQAESTEIDPPYGRVPLPEDYTYPNSSDEPAATSDSIIVVD